MRNRLIHGFLREVARGELAPGEPGEAPGKAPRTEELASEATRGTRAAAEAPAPASSAAPVSPAAPMPSASHPAADAAAFARWWEGRGAGGAAGGAARFAPAGARGGGWFAALDANADGVLSKAEVRRAPRSVLLRIGMVRIIKIVSWYHSIMVS